MENGFIYLIKTSGLVGLFYFAYLLLLRKETFFNANRWFLLLGLITSSVLPLFFITKIIWVEPTTESFDWSNIPVTTSVTAPEPEINWYLVLACIYFTGIVISFVKLVFDFNSLIQLLKGKKIQQKGAFKLIDIAENIAPFSYFNYIVYNSSLYTAVELENILEHEKVHSQQKHSIDVLISRLFYVVFWFNPLIWFYKKAIAQNLEFIADSEAAKKITDKKAYQFTLLKITTQENCVALTNHFYQSLIKKRIIMLNQNQSKKWNLWKYITVFPALVAFVFLFQIEGVAQEKKSKSIEKEILKGKSIEIVVTKNTTDEELKKYCEELKKTHDINLTFFNIKRNTNCEIINIESKSKDKTGSGTCKASENPIKPFKFFYNDTKKEMGYNMNLNSLSEDKEISNSNKSNIITINTNEKKVVIPNNTVAHLDDKISVHSVLKQNLESKPLIIIDGVKQPSNFKIEEISAEQIAKIDVLKGISAITQYGENGKNGVILITTKEKNEKKEFESPNDAKVIGIKITPDKEANGWKVEGVSSSHNFKEILVEDKNTDYNKAVIIIDGKISNSRKLNKLNPDKIDSINVRKIANDSEKETAIQKYGEKALNGIIEIKTKKLSNN